MPRRLGTAQSLWLLVVLIMQVLSAQLVSLGCGAQEGEASTTLQQTCLQLLQA